MITIKMPHGELTLSEKEILTMYLDNQTLSESIFSIKNVDSEDIRPFEYIKEELVNALNRSGYNDSFIKENL